MGMCIDRLILDNNVRTEPFLDGKYLGHVTSTCGHVCWSRDSFNDVVVLGWIWRCGYSLRRISVV